MRRGGGGHGVVPLRLPFEIGAVRRKMRTGKIGLVRWAGVYHVVSG